MFKNYKTYLQDFLLENKGKLRKIYKQFACIEKCRGGFVVKRPFDLLNNSIGKTVKVGMKAGKVATGKLLAFDIHMNLVLENCTLEELENGETKKTQLNQVFVRGDSLVYLSPQE